jgi:hypothetical protein
MSNIPQGTAANVLYGPAKLLIAALGTTLPTLDGTVNPITWPAGWNETGFTEDGTTLNYNPTIKDIMVDESMAPVAKVLDAEKASFSAKLAEATLTNLNKAISASILTNTAADATHAQIRRVDVGSGSLTKFMVGFEGINEAGFQRIWVGYIAIASANVSLAFKRSGNLVVPVEFALLNDSTKAIGKQLFAAVDILAPHS